LIRLFSSDAQQGRYLGYFQPNQLVVGPGWAVTAFDPFTSVDQVALTVDGIVIKRTAIGYREEPTEVSPPVATGESALGLDASWDAFDEGLNLARGGDPQAAIPLYNLVIASSALLGTTEVAVLRASAFRNRGVAYEDLLADPPWRNIQGGLLVEVMVSYRWLIDEYAESDDIDVRRNVVFGMLRLGIILGRQDDVMGAIEWFDRVLETGGDSRDPDIECSVADAMWNKAVGLNLLGDTDTTDQLLRDIVDRFSDSDTPCVIDVVSDAIETIEFRSET
jgi:hypothetical protein